MQKVFLLDENIGHHVAEYLKSSGYKVKLVPKGTKDAEVVKIAQKTGQILITHDSDFSNTLLYHQNKNYGIVILRVHPPKPDNIVKSIKFLLDSISYKDLYGTTVQVGISGIVALKKPFTK